MKKTTLALLILLVAVLPAAARKHKDNWQTLADLRPGKDAAEVAVNRTVRAIRIDCLEGPVIINTLVVREGAAKNPITVGRRFNAGESQDIDLGYNRNVTGLRISAGGRGTYRLSTK